MPNAAALVERYGYFAIFGLLTLGIVGPLIPDETILVISGILARKGHLDFLGVIGAGYGGSLCGITLSYILGRQGLAYVIERIPFMRRHSPRYLARVNDWFSRYGHWTLFFGYFVAGVRHFTALVAGSSKMRARPFALYAYTGGFIWVVCFVSIGYAVGDQWERIAHLVHRGATALAAGIVVGILLWFWWRKRR
jgi:membrane protein DedA with SNARE-associated domain